MPAWTLDVSRDLGISLHILFCGSGARQGGSAQGFCPCGESLTSQQVLRPTPTWHPPREAAVQRDGEERAPGALGWPRVGVLEHPRPRKCESLPVSEQGLWDKHSPAHCSSKQRGASHPILMGSLDSKTALGSGREIAPTNPPQASVIPPGEQFFPPSFPGA